MRCLIRWFDAWLRHRLGIEEFSSDPRCVLRIRPHRTSRPLPVPGGVIAVGAPVLELHLWNEHLPQLPPDGPNLAWATRGRRMLERSLRALAQYLSEAPTLQHVEGLVGVTVLFRPGECSGAERLFHRIGFSAAAAHDGGLGGFGRFWVNVYTWLIMWTYNRATLRARHVLALPRTEIWITREEFLRRYGNRDAATPAGCLARES